MEQYCTKKVAINQCQGILRALNTMKNNELRRHIRHLGGRCTTKTKKAILQEMLAALVNERLERIQAR